MYYLRKITRGKWPTTNIQQATLEDIEADTVVAEFQTDKNKLSVWKVDTEEDLKDAFVALVSNCDSIGTVDAIKIDEEDLNNILFDNEEGETPAKAINQKHCNITELNYVNLGTVIQAMIDGLKKENYIRKTKGEMKQLLADAYESDKLAEDELSPSVLRDIKKTIEKRNKL